MLRSESGDGRILLRDGLVQGAAIKGEPEDLRALLLAQGCVDGAGVRPRAQPRRRRVARARRGAPARLRHCTGAPRVAAPTARRALGDADVRLAQRRVQLRDPRRSVGGRPRAAAAVGTQHAVPRDGGHAPRRRVRAGARRGERRRPRRDGVQRRGDGAAGSRAPAISERERPAGVAARGRGRQDRARCRAARAGRG
jgi:hypothetical protein